MVAICQNQVFQLNISSQPDAGEDQELPEVQLVGAVPGAGFSKLHEFVDFGHL